MLARIIALTFFSLNVFYASLQDVHKKLAENTVEIEYEATEDRDMSNAMPGLQLFFNGKPHKAMKKSVTMFGTGVFVSDRGHVLTNYHVISKAENNASSIKIKFKDRSYDAVLVGVDKSLDIAVLRAQGLTKTTPVSWGDPERLVVGDPVFTYANSLGVGLSFRKGMITAPLKPLPRQKALVEGGHYMLDVIPSSILSFEGASGGGLANEKGELVGLNTFVLKANEASSVACSFAVPAYFLKDAVQDIIQHGYAKKPQLGVSIQTLTPQLAKSFNHKRETGVLVAEVPEESAAYKGGLRDGDLIIGFNGSDIKTDQELMSAVRRKNAGDIVTLKIMRQQKEVTHKVKLQEATSQKEHINPTAHLSKIANKNVTEVAGLRLAPYDEKNETCKEGVLIAEFNPQVFQKSAKLSAGDIIINADQQPVKKPQEVKNIITRALKEGRTDIVLLVLSNQVRKFIIFPIQEKNQ